MNSALSSVASVEPVELHLQANCGTFGPH